MNEDTATTTTSTDETDGGEIIYSDAGLEPVNPTNPPIVHQQQQQSAGDSSAESVLNSDQISPQAAFEIFQGKVYSASIPNTTINAAKASTSAGGDESTPLERLARLQQEVTALEAELKMTVAADSGRSFDEQVVQLATDLKNRLVATSSTHVTEQDNLTRLIHEQLQNIQKKDATTSAAAAAAAAAVGAVSLPQTGLVYELYGNATNPTTTMEERLLNLERLLGNSQQNALSSSSSSSQTNSASSTSTNHKSLLHRLEEMETLVATVDSTTLEKTATKAKVIRADLEAASKARNKLTATYKKEDSKMIQQLYQQMVDLEGLGSYLPSLVERLQQLSHLHRQASTFGTRLQELERGTTQVEATVGQLEDGMTTLQKTIVQNIAAMEKNLQELDKKLSGL
jgi:uncharacterized protein (UPF0335 family)